MLSGGAPLIERPTARIVVLDPDNRILLFRANIGHSVEPERVPDAKSFLALPGGGIEPGETPEAAARRELREETGIVANETLPFVALRETVYPWKGKRYFTREHIFYVRAAGTHLDSSGWLEGDRRWMSDLGWWTLAALTETHEIVRPPGLVALANTLARGLLPATPVLLSHA